MFQAIFREPTPVRAVQEALRIIYPDSTLTVDGIYGPKTREMVRRFQQDYGLPVTGVVDLDTWDALRKKAKERRIFEGQAEPLRIVLQPNQVIARGSDNLLVYLVQAMLKAMARYYVDIPDVSITGSLDAPTANAIARFQRACNLPETGNLDKNTWRHLVKHYRLAVGDGTGTLPTRKAPQGPNEIRTSQ